MSTIKDVAARAGVSYTTVSHVVNGTRFVSDEVRQRVLTAIKEIGYRPSAAARSLRTNESNFIGLLIPTVQNPFFAELVFGVEERCRASNYSVFLCNADDIPGLQLQYLRRLLENRVDGLVISSAANDDEVAHAVGSSLVPAVTLDRTITGPKVDLVCEDNLGGARLAVSHLLSLGHRRIACLTGPEKLTFAKERVDGWRSALMQYGVEPETRLLVESDFSSQGGYQATRQLLQDPVNRGNVAPVTAIFAGNDMMAIGALRAAAELGVKVPDQLSIVGFDDIDLGRYVFPSLTTVGCSIKEMGRKAASFLIERIEQPETPFRAMSMDHILSIRESTAVVPSPG